jgi:hypothetical protein
VGEAAHIRGAFGVPLSKNRWGLVVACGRICSVYQLNSVTDSKARSRTPGQPPHPLVWVAILKQLAMTSAAADDDVPAASASMSARTCGTAREASIRRTS